MPGRLVKHSSLQNTELKCDAFRSWYGNLLVIKSISHYIGGRKTYAKIRRALSSFFLKLNVEVRHGTVFAKQKQPIN